MQIQREEKSSTLCLSFFLSDSSLPPDLFFLSLAHSFPLSTLLFLPQVCIPGQQLWRQPSQVCGCWRPSVSSPRSLPSPPPRFTCRGVAALILAPPLSFPPPAQTSAPSGLISQQLPAQARPLLLLNFARRGCPDTLSNALAEFKDLKKKKNPNTFTYRPGQLSAGGADEGTLKCGVCFLQTVSPFHDMNSLPSNHLPSQLPVHSSQSPGVTTHPFQETNHWVICNARGNSVQPKNPHFLLPSLLSPHRLNTPWWKVKPNIAYFYRFTESQFSWFLI